MDGILLALKNLKPSAYQQRYTLMAYFAFGCWFLTTSEPLFLRIIWGYVILDNVILLALAYSKDKRIIAPVVPDAKP